MADYLPEPSNVRRGRFLWMPEPARRDYLELLREKITSRYFFSDAVFQQLADDLAPLYVDSTGNE
ncbi:MAG: hypothetical protein JW768_12885 [Chitinispirillaceae bacterium]|nr:hypothetical protein [Chitinispirillaceae bacterium]